MHPQPRSRLVASECLIPAFPERPNDVPGDLPPDDQVTARVVAIGGLEHNERANSAAARKQAHWGRVNRDGRISASCTRLEVSGSLVGQASLPASWRGIPAPCSQFRGLGARPWKRAAGMPPELAGKDACPTAPARAAAGFLDPGTRACRRLPNTELRPIGKRRRHRPLSLGLGLHRKHLQLLHRVAVPALRGLLQQLAALDGVAFDAVAFEIAHAHVILRLW